MTDATSDAGRAATTYAARRDARKVRVEHLAAIERRLATARLVVFAAGLPMVWLALVRETLSPLALLLPGAVFLWLVVWHNRRIADRECAERAGTWYVDGISRIVGRWRAPTNGAELVPADHPHALDLDIVGDGGLFARLATARTARGREILARWLTTSADAATIRSRQEAVRELTTSLDLREDLAVQGDAREPEIHAGALVAWGQGPPVLPGRVLRLVALASSILTAAGLGALLAGRLPLLAPVAVLLHIALAYAVRRRTAQVLHQVEEPARELALLAGFTERLARERFDARRLQALHGELAASGAGVTGNIRALSRLVDLLDSARNQLFLPIALLLHWQLHLAHEIDAWRVRHGPGIARWIDAVGELEALTVLGGYAFEHPEDVHPDVVETTGFHARGLAHPFLPLDVGVRNDVQLGGETPLLVVSGSNMSGKSTLLRSIGVNAALAHAGAPVRARELRFSPFEIGASLRVGDSLEDGRSRFLAEIERLKTLVDLSRGERPLLFLVDEVLQGTNSHDRRIGAEAIMRTLIENGALGVLTTHDLALTELADSLRGARNAHFQDHMEEGRMVFDYALRDGVVTRSNAVALMRRVGLDV